MGDSLKGRISSCIEFEHIRDLVMADPIRDIVLDFAENYDSADGSAQPPNRIWLERITITPGTTKEINLRLGTLNGVQMRDGFGQLVAFSTVRAIRIYCDANSYIMLSGAVADPWLNLFTNGTEDINLLGGSEWILRGSEWLIGAGPPYGSSFELTQNAGAAASATVDVCIIGYHS